MDADVFFGTDQEDIVRAQSADSSSFLSSASNERSISVDADDEADDDDVLPKDEDQVITQVGNRVVKKLNAEERTRRRREREERIRVKRVQAASKRLSNASSSPHSLERMLHAERMRKIQLDRAEWQKMNETEVGGSSSSRMALKDRITQINLDHSVGELIELVLAHAAAPECAVYIGALNSRTAIEVNAASSPALTATTATSSDTELGDGSVGDRSEKNDGPNMSLKDADAAGYFGPLMSGCNNAALPKETRETLARIACRVIQFAPEQDILDNFAVIIQCISNTESTPLAVLALRMVIVVADIMPQVIDAHLELLLSSIQSRLKYLDSCPRQCAFRINPMVDNSNLVDEDKGALSEHARLIGLVLEIIGDQLIIENNKERLGYGLGVYIKAVETLCIGIAPIAAVIINHMATLVPNIVALQAAVVLECFLGGCTQLVEALVVIVKLNPEPFHVAFERLSGMYQASAGVAHDTFRSNLMMLMSRIYRCKPITDFQLDMCIESLSSKSDTLAAASMQMLYEVARSQSGKLEDSVLAMICSRSLVENERYHDHCIDDTHVDACECSCDMHVYHQCEVHRVAAQVLGCAAGNIDDPHRQKYTTSLLGKMLLFACYGKAGKSRDDADKSGVRLATLARTSLAALRYVARDNPSLIADYSDEVMLCIDSSDQELKAAAQKIQDIFKGYRHDSSEWTRRESEFLEIKELESHFSLGASETSRFIVRIDGAKQERSGQELHAVNRNTNITEGRKPEKNVPQENNDVEDMRNGNISNKELRVSKKTIAIEGVLHKKGEGFFAFWEMRWFECDEAALRWFTVVKHKGQYSPNKYRNHLELSSVAGIGVTEDADSERSFQFYISLKNGKNRMLAAETLELRDKWINCLTLATQIKRNANANGKE